MKWICVSIFAALVCFGATPAHAENIFANIVAACGTPNAVLSPGAPGQVTMDTTGKLCSSGSGGGGGGAITAPLGPTTAPSAAVAITDTGTPPTGDTIPAGGQGLTGWLAAIYTAVNSPIPAGSNVIGGVTAADGALATEGAKADTAYAGSGSASIVAALKGLYNAVTSAIPAGSAIIGKVGIDQTTPGTTNGVQVNSSVLPTGASTAALQPALGQQLAAASEPVVLTAIQVAAITPPTVAVSVAPVTATNPAIVVDLRPDSPGIIALGPAIPASSVPVVNAGFTYGHISTDTTTTLKSGAGVLHSICVNTVGASSTITVDDNTTAATPNIAILSGATLGCYTYDVAFATGLTIVTAVAAPDLTVSYR
jgi:hypothetical protein